MAALAKAHGAKPVGPNNPEAAVVWSPDGDRSVVLHRSHGKRLGPSHTDGPERKMVVLIVYSTLSVELFANPLVGLVRNPSDPSQPTFLLADCTGLNPSEEVTIGKKVHTMDALHFGFALCAFKLLKFENTNALAELFSHIWDASEQQPYVGVELPITEVTEIAHATPQIAHTITQFTLLHAPHLLLNTVQMMLDTWIRTKNWAAIQVIQLARSVMEQRCISASLNGPIPEQLRGFSCHLQLRCFHINRLPRWTLENPNVLLSTETCNISSSGNQKLTPTNIRKLVLVGDSGVGKTTLLKCMIQKKKVITIQKQNAPTDGIERHNLRFKKGKTGFKWTVWDLGGYTPFHPCYMCSRSIFIVVFDVREAIAVEPPQRPRLYYWLNEIAVAQSRSMRSFEQAQVLLVGTHVEPHLFEDAVQLVSKIACREVPFCIPVVFLLGFKGEAWRYRFTDPKPKPIGQPVQEIVDILENELPDTSLSDDGVLKSVPQSWMMVNKELKKRRDRTDKGGHHDGDSGYMEWSQFVELAKQCGVGRHKLARQEIETCANFLMADWVALDLNWKNASNALRVITLRGVADTFGVPQYESEGSASSAMNEALARFEAIVELEKAPQQEFRFFSFFAGSNGYPEVSASHLIGFWSQTYHNCKVQGRVITFPLLPPEVFFKVMTKVLNSPGWTPTLLCADALIVSRPLNHPDVSGDVLFLMIREGNTVSMCLRSDWKGYTPTPLKDLPTIHTGLWRTLLGILEQFTEAMYYQREERASFPWENKFESSLACPHCLLNFVVSPKSGDVLTSALSTKTGKISAFPKENVSTFDQREFVKAMQNGEQQLTCNSTERCQVDLVEIAPDLFLEITSGVAKNTLTEVTRAESCYNTMLKFISYVKLVQCMPHHDNVAQVSSVHFQPSPGVVMESPSVPHPELVLGKSFISLGELVSILIEKGNNTTTELDRVIPHHLREKILLDVAEGLNHLHSQSPPVVHNGVHPGGILVFSLDESGPGPLAKISLSENTKDLFLGTTRGIAGNPDISFHAPEVLCKTFYNTKADIWSFGTLVWKLHNPLSMLFGHLMNNALYTETKYTSTMGVYSTVLSPQQIGRGLVDGHIRMESELFRPERRHCCSPTMMTPRWARQVVSLCCVVDPALRPTMIGIRKAWSFFNPGALEP
ncbi:hypothetical protein Pelo_17644 [Pelomyxa schiedti]|nr:hypothetical protein Pelo_17644 [Pelomyxa schiedti]